MLPRWSQSHWQAREGWDQTWLENVSGRDWALLTDIKQKSLWQVVSGTSEKASDWRGIRDPPQIQNEALISCRAIRVKRVLSIMKLCSELQCMPGGFSLTKHFPLNLTTLILQLFTAAVLSHCRKPCINIFTFLQNLDLWKIQNETRRSQSNKSQETFLKYQYVLQKLFKRETNYMSIWHDNVLHTEKLALKLWAAKVTHFRMKK